MMAEKMSDIVARVQKTVDEINSQVGKSVLSEPMVDRGNPHIIIMFGRIGYSIVIDKSECGTALSNHLRTRLRTRLIGIKEDLEQNLEELGHIQEI